MAEIPDPVKMFESIETEHAERIYRTLYKTLGNAIGLKVAQNILGIQEKDFKGEDPKKALGDMVGSLRKFVGATAVRNMLYVTVTEEFGDSESKAILEAIGLDVNFDLMR